MTLARKLSSKFEKPRVARARGRWWTAVAVVLLSTAGIAQRGPTQSDVSQDRPGQGSPVDSKQPLAAPRNPDVGALPPMAQAQIFAAIGEDERAYHVLAQPRGLRLNNASHTLSAEFTPTGVELRHGTNRWGMALRGYGYGNTLRETGPMVPTASANRVEYRRGALTEWYVNGPLGLEQGFTIERAPEHSNGQPLTLALALSGNLTASVAPGGRALTLSKNGASALRYAGLTAWDADRRDLRAWLEIAGDRLHVRVDDAGARYPVTIDPYVQAAKLTTVKPCDASGICDDGAPGDVFGYSVSISADASTVVVGVPYKFTNGVSTGVAYVFVKPSDFEGGWNSIYPIFYKTKLLASDGATNGRRLGWSVDISRDGGTIVAGARGFEVPMGAA